MKTSPRYSDRPLAWQRLKAEHGFLRRAAMAKGVSYCRLSEILNGWIIPTNEEIRRLGLTERELNELAKRQTAPTTTK